MANVDAWAINDALQRIYIYIYALYGMLSLNEELCNSSFVYICEDLKLLKPHINERKQSSHKSPCRLIRVSVRATFAFC